MESKNIEIYFFNYLEKIHSAKPIKTNSAITKTKWVKTDNTISNSNHPPLDAILVNYKGTSITASPFKLPTNNSECKQIVEQVNYTNQCLKVIGRQLDKIETKLEEGTTSCIPSTSKQVEKPLIHLPEKWSTISLDQSQNIQKIENILTKLIIKEEPVTPQITVMTQPNETSSQMSSFDEDITKLQEQFTDQKINHGIKRLVYPSTNPTSLTKNWYSRPTPPDLQYEENNLANQFSVSSSKLYEWNIDGLSEHQILEKLNHMSMVANSYLSNTNLNQP
ncbi:hypothetical protein RHMOL_Rhmol10G0202300 [Rhododendron molle]|uniref:Uncharacterized protein n=1 Tax=Rhododendron molle TaxID=49168 RepID=A0ACC0M5G5_RHOML|nr:hypothetical protein RHMOL_Rhmol10G0202300 [Rhododendron molle]